MADKKRKKLGLSLKTTKKLIVEDKKTSKRQNDQSSKPRVIAYPKTVVTVEAVDVDGPDEDIQRSVKSNFTVAKKIGTNDSERLLWRNIFSSDVLKDWKNLGDLPKPDESVLTPNTKTNTSGSNSKLELTSNNVSFLGSSYVDLPKPCITCCTRKPVKLDLMLESIQKDDFESVSQSDNDQTISKTCSLMPVYDKSRNFAIPIGGLDDEKMHVRGGSFNQNIQQKLKTLGHQKGHFTERFQGILSKEKEICMTSKERTSRSSNVVIDLTEDDSKHYSNLHTNSNKWVSSNITSVRSKNPLNKPHVNDSLVMSKQKSERTVGSYNGQEIPGIDGLTCCPMCQVKFSHRFTTKQEIDSHISSCIGDEIIIDDDSDEDCWG